MKVYPKIPRYDHPVVPDDFFEAGDLTLLEKYDGSSFRFTLYDDRYADVYPEQVVAAADGPGSLVFGTRKSIRGSHRDALETIDGALHRAVRCLGDGIDTAALRSLHDDYGSPLIVYAENLVYSTLDYGYTERGVPALVGFDVLPYAAVESMTAPGDPYAETFEGFLDRAAAWDVFERIAVDGTPLSSAFVPAASHEPDEAFDPETVTFPASSVSSDVTVEGLVIRSDEQDRRVKIVREAFRERNRVQFGQRPSETETGAEYVVAAYCTSGRIRKQVRTMVVEEGYEFGLHLNEDLYPRVVEDIWAENWHELMELELSFTPADVFPLVAKRCIDELRQMKTNAELNDTGPTDLWRHLD